MSIATSLSDPAFIPLWIAALGTFQYIFVKIWSKHQEANNKQANNQIGTLITQTKTSNGRTVGEYVEILFDGQEIIHKKVDNLLDKIELTENKIDLLKDKNDIDHELLRKEARISLDKIVQTQIDHDYKDDSRFKAVYNILNIPDPDPTTIR